MNDSKLKLDNSKSRFGKKLEEEKVNKVQFETEITEFQKEQAQLMKKITDLTSQFVGFIKDKTLTENKGPILLDLERSIPKELSELSLKIDNDESINEICIGSNGLILLLLRTSLIQRDLINELNYKISKLEEKFVESKKSYD